MFSKIVKNEINKDLRLRVRKVIETEVIRKYGSEEGITQISERLQCLICCKTFQLKRKCYPQGIFADKDPLTLMWSVLKTSPGVIFVFCFCLKFQIKEILEFRFPANESKYCYLLTNAPVSRNMSET